MTIEVQLHERAPAQFHPGAMAYATPFADSGTRIHVLCDRAINPSLDSGTGALLGYVMAHEITHVLEGADRHSAQGVMKARWEIADFQQMASLILAFDPTDAELIRIALEKGQRGRRRTNRRRGSTESNGRSCRASA